MIGKLNSAVAELEDSGYLSDDTLANLSFDELMLVLERA